MSSRARRRLRARDAGRFEQGCSRSVPVVRVSRAVLGASLVGLSVAGSVALAGPAAAADYEVTTLADTGPGSLRDVVELTNANPGADTITFAPGLSGTIQLTSEILIHGNVTITGPADRSIVVDGQDATRLFQVSAQDGLVNLTNLVLQNGNAGMANDGGGAVQTFNVDLVLTNVELTGNEAMNGGAVWAGSALVTLVDSTLSGNTAVFEGGGMFVYVSDGVSLSGTTFSDNQSGGRGGAAFLQGAMQVAAEDSTFADNTAVNAGAIYQIAGQLELAESVVSGNTALNGVGGGVYLQSAQAQVDGSSITGNTAASGGGAFDVSNSTAMITNSTLSGNTAGVGGAIRLNQGNLALGNTTIAGNTALAGSVIELFTDGAVNTVTADHVTMADNTGDSGLDLDPGALAQISHSVLAGTSGSSDLAATGQVDIDHTLVETTEVDLSAGTGNLTGVDPLLSALADNGGPTTTMLPASDSPVVDAGDPTYSVFPTDQRGELRTDTPVAGATPVTDLGAVELTAADLVVDGGGEGAGGDGSGGAGGSGTTAGSGGATTTGTTTALANTGADASLLLPTAGGLLAAGGLLTLLGLRRRRPEGTTAA